MQNITHTPEESTPNLTIENTVHANESGYSEPIECRVIRRDGKLTPFDRSKITIAMTKAFLAVEGSKAAASNRVHEQVEQLTQKVADSLLRHLAEDRLIHIENIQDQVELALMRSENHKVARAYVLYREQHAQQRHLKDSPTPKTDTVFINIALTDGTLHPITLAQLANIIDSAVQGLEFVDANLILESTKTNLFEGMSEKDLYTSLVMSARAMIEQDPDYNYAAARLLLRGIIVEAQSRISYVEQKNSDTNSDTNSGYYLDYFAQYISTGIELELLDPELGRYDLSQLSSALIVSRDQDFTYMGLQTLYDRYFINDQGTRIELPQAFFMRVAMGLAINEIDREQRAIEFYLLLSSFDFMSSTPTLFNSGTLHPQLSSCYLSTVPDDLAGIYSALKDNALLSKYAGGLGNDWTQVRGLGSYIKGTNGRSQGVVPFLKVANDTAVAVNQGGKRKGATCAYLETWHIDIEEFLELRKNTGDERRRTHDMNTANWVPDLFMIRVVEEAQWTLFSPEETPDLHELSGKKFAAAYIAYEEKAARGDIKNFKTVSASDLWRKMLGMLFETGHPWITFKDPCNIRYTNQHIGTVHSSNLCTEITLHTNSNEIAVCNLGSVNLAAHIDDNGLNLQKLEKTITTAMRMLDNVIDYNFYAVGQARNSNLQHRPVGLGIMGFQDALYQLEIPYGGQDAVEFADSSMEAVSYFAIKASCTLAAERGRYASYEGSLWSQGILPFDSNELLAEQRGNYIHIDTSSQIDWSQLRAQVQQHGLRNSNCLAIAPTATIANICGVSQSIEPAYQNLYVKSNLSGEFTVVNSYLAKALKKLKLWDSVMVNDLKYFDGSVATIDRVPEALKSLFSTAFELDSCWLIEAAARRQKWIDQSQSLNLYLAQPSGKKLDQLYKLAWVSGLKTTYYLRSLAATHIEKTTSNKPVTNDEATAKACLITDPECEACQ
ncbi:Ribonucleotide reductase of class Ia (aerobic), alpha subunit [hydrothermal vent metagenome]|uniref:ribonucleoside-diphosphate reductase n=1 Tax=hydrothermal vent metagenome TaxID=652676 RepID=A0A3B0Z2F9_9ZZZZ